MISKRRIAGWAAVAALTAIPTVAASAGPASAAVINPGGDGSVLTCQSGVNTGSLVVGQAAWASCTAPSSGTGTFTLYAYCNLDNTLHSAGPYTVASNYTVNTNIYCWQGVNQYWISAS